MGKWVLGIVAVVVTVTLVGGCVVGGTALSSYNTLVTKREATKASWGQVENVYQRRADLVPNLVETARGYAIHENETFVAVTEARAKVGQVNIKADQIPDAVSLAKFQQVQGELSSAMSRLMVVMEKYPDLKANDLFRDLMVQMEGTENRITVERRRYNEMATDYNSTRNVFPTNVIANWFNFEAFPYFKAEEGANKAPKVDFKDLRKK